MTIQALSFIRKIRKAQITEHGSVYIDFDNMLASTCHTANEPCVTVSLKRYRNSARAILAYLQDLGYIKYDRPDYVDVLHKGWHITQSFVSTLGAFLVKSILIPIVVSIITTLIAAWLSGLLK